MFFSGEIYQYVLNIYYVTGLVLDAEDMQILARLRGRQSMRWLNSITDSTDMNEQNLGDSGQKSLASYTPWGLKESDTT